MIASLPTTFTSTFFFPRSSEKSGLLLSFLSPKQDRKRSTRLLICPSTFSAASASCITSAYLCTPVELPYAIGPHLSLSHQLSSSPRIQKSYIQDIIGLVYLSNHPSTFLAGFLLTASWFVQGSMSSSLQAGALYHSCDVHTFIANAPVIDAARDNHLILSHSYPLTALMYCSAWTRRMDKSLSR